MTRPTSQGRERKTNPTPARRTRPCADIEAQRFMIRDPFDNRAKAPAVRQPALVIHGERDGIVPPTPGATRQKGTKEGGRKGAIRTLW